MHSSTIAGTLPTPERPRYAAAIWTLLLLAPFVGEILSGSTRTSILFVYIPEIMVWGVGALFCRELVRRWRAGSLSLVLVALALAMAEEFIIQQTSLAPLPFPGVHPDYGRMWGVNLVYLLSMLGFESVWVVIVPTKLTELCFPRKAAQPWLRTLGAIVACVVFLLGSRIAWYGWTQQARPRLHAVPYSPSWTMIGLGLAAIGLLIALAYMARGVGASSPEDRRGTVPAWLAGLTAFVMGAPWFGLIGQNFVPRPVQPFWIAIVAGLAWAGIACALFVSWSSRPGWTEGHRFAAACGSTLACMAAPYLSIASWPKIDIVGLIVFDVLALIGLSLLSRKIFTRAKINQS